MSDDIKKMACIYEKRVELFVPNGMFRTFEGFNELVDYFERFSAESRSVAFMAMGLTINAFIHELEKYKVGEIELDEVAALSADGDEEG